MTKRKRTPEPEPEPEPAAGPAGPLDPPPPPPPPPPPAPPAYAAPPAPPSASQAGPAQAPQYAAQPPTPPHVPPAYPYGPAYAGPPVTAHGRPTNNLAITSLALSAASWIICPVLPAIAGVVLGHMAWGQIRKTGEGGEGLAVAGLIIGYANIVVWILVVLLLIILGIVALIGAAQQPG